jgi:histone deacetylase 1/2
LCSLVQQDEDKEDPNERRDADSDMEMNYVKPSEDSARYF